MAKREDDLTYEGKKGEGVWSYGRIAYAKDAYGRFKIALKGWGRGGKGRLGLLGIVYENDAFGGLGMVRKDDLTYEGRRE